MEGFDGAPRRIPGRRATTLFGRSPATTGSQAGELVLEWFDGEYYPPEHIRKLYSADLKDYPPESSMLIGTEGSLLIPLGTPPQLLPEEKFSNVQRPKLPPRNHYHHFVDACLGGEQTESPLRADGSDGSGYPLGTVAIRMPGQKLQWDGPRLKVTNSAEANHYLQRRYRNGWHLARF